MKFTIKLYFVSRSSQNIYVCVNINKFCVFINCHTLDIGFCAPHTAVQTAKAAKTQHRIISIECIKEMGISFVCANDHFIGVDFHFITSIDILSI